MTPWAYEVHEGASARVLALTGEIDLHAAPRLLADLPGLLAHAPAVVVDLTEVTFLDSSGLRVLDRLVRACTVSGTPWRVACRPGSPPRRVLELVGMAGPGTHDDRAAALADLA